MDRIKTENQRNINHAVANELVRIVLFVLYYILHIVLGIGLFIGAFYISKLSIIAVLASDVVYGRVVFWVIVGNLVMWIMAAMVGFYLIKPLFKFTKSKNPKRVEITEQECPKLFEMIREVAKTTKCKMPKHVYLSPDVNACVFYNTSFWSIIFPVRKNLEIGLGLFDGLNVSEIEAIIGHEFGHFAQDSMKVGSAVYVTNTILYNLVCTDDSWDNTINKMRLSDMYSMRAAGWLTQKVTGVIGNNTARVFRFEQKGYMKLSRYIEFDADSVACNAVGSNAFVSAMAKLDIVSYEEQQYERILGSLISTNKTIGHYFDSKHITDQTIPRYGMPKIDSSSILTEVQKSQKVKAKVRVEDIWSSHPSTEDRIAKAKELGVQKEMNTSSAWSLIPNNIKDKVSEHLIGLIASSREELTTVSEEEFRAFTKNSVENEYMREDIAPFFNRDILLFNTEEVDITTPVQNPFTDSNALIVEQYNTLIHDYRILVAVKEGQIDVKEVMYDGVVYKRDKVPLEILKAEYDKLVRKVWDIDKSVYAFLVQQSSSTEKEHITHLYSTLCYIDYMNREVLPEVNQNRDAFVAELTRVTRRDESEFNELLQQIQAFGSYVKQVTNALDYEHMEDFVIQEGLEGWRKFASEKHEFFLPTSKSISREALNNLIAHIDSILAAFGNGASYINGQLATIAESVTSKSK